MYDYKMHKIIHSSSIVGGALTLGGTLLRGKNKNSDNQDELREKLEALEKVQSIEFKRQGFIMDF